MIQLRTDPNQKVIELGGGSNPQIRPNVDVRQCYDAQGNPTVDFTANFDEPLPIQSDEWDCVFSHFVIEHINWRKVRPFISEMFRILKPGGRAVVVTANTMAQFQWILNNQGGWDGKPSFESFSGIIFGDQDYPENTHKNFMCPELADVMFKQAGFSELNIKPYGARATDMCIVAEKPKDAPTQGNIIQNEGDKIAQQISTALENAPKPSSEQVSKEVLLSTPPKEIFTREYFNGGGKFGSCVPPKEFYWDHPSNDIILQSLMMTAPKSVLEVGAGRGYLTKRLIHRGIPAVATDVSDHCWLTRVVPSSNFICRDMLKFPWPIGKKEFDLLVTVDFLSYIPPSLTEKFVEEVNRVSKRSWHAVRFDRSDRPYDKAFMNDMELIHWNKLFASLEAPTQILEYQKVAGGQLSDAVLNGDGKSKLNLGCYMTMFHHGWLNIDVHDLGGFAQKYGYRYMKRDLTKGLEQKPSEVDMIYMSHVLEHLSYEQGLSLLRECRRVIKPDTGVMRLSVPDAQTLMNYFSKKEMKNFAELNPLCKEDSGIKGLNDILYSGHQAVYDWETLENSLKQTNWEPVLVEQGQGDPQMLRETLDMLPDISMFVEARPKRG